MSMSGKRKLSFGFKRNNRPTTNFGSTNYQDEDDVVDSEQDVERTTKKRPRE